MTGQVMQSLPKTSGSVRSTMHRPNMLDRESPLIMMVAMEVGGRR